MRITLVTAVLVATLALLEAGARILNFPAFTQGLRSFHPELGWKLEPNLEVYNGSPGNRLLIETNKFGFRDLNYPPQHPPDIKRVAVVGDSFSEAFQVNREETFWALLATTLNRRKERASWEVLNFGIGDYGTTQEHLLLEREVWNFRPDLVVLQIFPFNDVLNNSLLGAGLSSPQDFFRPYADPKTLYREITYGHPVAGSLRRLSRFYLLMEGALMKIGLIPDLRSLEVFREKQKQAAARYGLYHGDGDPGLSLVMNVFADPSAQIPEVRQGWEATEALLAQIVESCRNKNVPLVAMVIPHSIQLEGADRKWMSFSFNPQYAEDRIADFLEKFQVPTLKLMSAFSRERSQVLPYIDGHLNPSAHRIVANELGDLLSKQGFPPKLSLGQIIDVNRGPSRGYLSEGFAKPEAGASWSVGREAKISFMHSFGKDEKVRLILKAKPFVPPQGPGAMTVEASVNGGPWQRIYLQRNFEFQTVEIPMDLTPKVSRVEIDLKFGNLSSPSELGMSKDGRKLGLAVSQLWIERREKEN